MYIFRIISVLVLVLSILSTALGDDSSKLTLEEIVVTATRSPAKLSKVSAFGTVISRNQINKLATNNLGELLKSADFVQMRDWGPSSISSASIRGASSSQVLVLVDGQRVNSVQNGSADLDKISLDGINRIELIRGGQSALYGADAAGGIINVITEDYENQINLKSSAGSLGYLLWNASIKHKFKKLSSMISYSQSQNDGNFQFEDKFGKIRTRENSDYLKRNALAKLKWNPRDSTNLIISGRHSYSDSGDPGPAGQYSPDAFMKQLTNSVRIKLDEQVKDNWKFESTLFGRSSRQHYFNPNGLVKIDDTHKVRSTGGRLQSQFYFSEDMPFTAGISIRKEELSSTSVGDRDRTSIGLYLQQELKLTYNGQTISVYPALRFDEYSDFDAGLSPKLGMLIELFDDLLSIKGNAGRSYRAPTMNDLYWPEDAFAMGNPELKPEKSVDFDVGIELKSPKILDIAQLKCNIAYFRNDYSDLIEWAPGITRKWTPTNRSEAKIQGIETSIDFLATELFRVDASYTFLSAHDSLGRQLMYRPYHSASYHLNLGKRNLWLQLDGKYQSKRYYTRENTRWLEPFLVHDFRLGATKSIMKQVNLTGILEFQNIFDADYQLIADYPLPGRQWRFKLMFEWQGG